MKDLTTDGIFFFHFYETSCGFRKTPQNARKKWVWSFSSFVPVHLVVFVTSCCNCDLKTQVYFEEIRNEGWDRPLDLLLPPTAPRDVAIATLNVACLPQVRCRSHRPVASGRPTTAPGCPHPAVGYFQGRTGSVVCCGHIIPHLRHLRHDVANATW